VGAFPVTEKYLINYFRLIIVTIKVKITFITFFPLLFLLISQIDRFKYSPNIIISLNINNSYKYNSHIIINNSYY